MGRISPRWVRSGTTWLSVRYPGWRVEDTGRRGKRDRYVIVSPDGTRYGLWHQAYMHKAVPALNDAKEAAETRARYAS